MHGKIWLEVLEFQLVRLKKLLVPLFIIVKDHGWHGVMV